MSLTARLILTLLLGAAIHPATAVHISPDGMGEVLIFPYYTVNNDLNTLYSVVNTSADAKAIRVRIVEGDIGLDVLTFNVYMDAFDVWTGVLVPSVSSIAGHVGEPTADHVSLDTSCAPFLIKAGQELLPYVIDTDLDPDNHNMQRSTEGHIEVYEMGVLTGAPRSWVDHRQSGVPFSCGSFEMEWTNNGQWDSGDLEAPTGQLMGSATLMNVSEGIAFPYDAIALQNFWQGTAIHTEPGSLEPKLDAAFPQSTIFLSDGTLSTAEWAHGYEAVSNVLSHFQIINEFALDVFVFGKTEWVLNFPTKFHHTAEEPVHPPFNSVWDGAMACETVQWDIWDRESTYQPHNPICIGSPCPPRPLLPKLCQSLNVLDFYSETGTPQSPTAVLGSSNQLSVFIQPYLWAENGYGQVSFPDALPTSPLTGDFMYGMPVVGFAVQQFTNAGAAQGLLAQYGSLFEHKYKRVLVNPEAD